MDAYTNQRITELQNTIRTIENAQLAARIKEFTTAPPAPAPALPAAAPTAVANSRFTPPPADAPMIGFSNKISNPEPASQHRQVFDPYSGMAPVNLGYWKL